eukprot:2573673-Prymnesium_polylepis.1
MKGPHQLSAIRRYSRRRRPVPSSRVSPSSTHTERAAAGSQGSERLVRSARVGCAFTLTGPSHGAWLRQSCQPRECECSHVVGPHTSRGGTCVALPVAQRYLQRSGAGA